VDDSILKCQKCGNTNYHDATYCLGCGSNLNPESPDNSTFSTLDNPPYADNTPQYHGEEPPRKKRAAFIVVALLTAIVVGGSILGATVFREQLMLAFLGNERFAKTIVRNAIVNELTAGILANAEDYYTLLSQENNYVSLQMLLDSNVNKSSFENLLVDMGMFSYEIDPLLLLASSSFDLTMNANLSDTANPLMDIDIEWKAEGASILTINLKAIDNVMYISAPKLYDRILTIDLDEYGMDAALIEEMMLGFDPTDLMLELTKTLSDNQPLILSMVGDVVDAFLDEVDEIRFDSNVPVEINNNTTSLNRLNISMSGESTSKGLTAALNVILDNEDYISLLVDIGNSVTTNMGWSSTRISRSDLIDGINVVKEDLAYIPDDDSVEIELFVSRSREFRGINLTVTEAGHMDILGEVGFVFNPDIGFEFYFSENGTGFQDTTRIHGDLISGSNGKSGNVRVTHLSEMGPHREQFSLKILDFENLRTSRVNGVNSLNYRLIFDLDHLIRELVAYDLMDNSSELDVLAGSSVTLEVTSQGNAEQFILTFDSDIIDLSLLLSSEFVSQVSIEPPGAGYDVFDDIMELDFGKLESNLFDLVGEIERAGFNADWLDELLRGVFLY